MWLVQGFMVMIYYGDFYNLWILFIRLLLELPTICQRYFCIPSQFKNNILSPCSRVLLEKLTIPQLVKKFSAFYGTPKAHYRVYKCPPPVPILSQIIPVHAPHSTCWRPILILSSHLCLGLPSDLFPSGFPIKTLYATLLSHMHATCAISFLIWAPE